MDSASDNKSIFMKLEEGEKKIRVIGDIHAVKEHSVLIEGRSKFIACPTENARMLIEAGELPTDSEIPACPLCELGYPVKTSYLAIAVDRDSEEAGVLKKGPKVLGEIQGLIDDEDWGAAGDYDIKITATGEGLKRKYTVMGVPANKSKPLTEKEESSLSKLLTETNLEKMTTPKPYSEIAKQTFELGEYVKEEK